MHIAFLMEGKTEQVFVACLKNFLGTHLAGRLPKIDPLPYDGRIPREGQLRGTVRRLLNDPKRPADAVIALTDVYTGTNDFRDAADAKAKMKQWVGNEPRFHPHAAQYEFEAWLLPYWDAIRNLSGTRHPQISGPPEQVNHGNPPASRLKEVLRLGSRRGSYSKTRDATRILRDQDLMVAIQACPKLKALVNTIIGLCGGTTID